MRIAFGFILGYFVADNGGAVEASRLFLGYLSSMFTYIAEGINWLANL